MPYFHIKDNGRVNFWTRRCQVCGARWGVSAYLLTKIPKGMGWKPPSKIVVSPGRTSYARWGDKFPGVSIVASHLPNWPRWVRVLTAFLFVTVIVCVVVLFLR